MICRFKGEMFKFDVSLQECRYWSFHLNGFQYMKHLFANKTISSCDDRHGPWQIIMLRNFKASMWNIRTQYSPQESDS